MDKLLLQDEAIKLTALAEVTGISLTNLNRRYIKPLEDLGLITTEEVGKSIFVSTPKIDNIVVKKQEKTPKIDNIVVKKQEKTPKIDNIVVKKQEKTPKIDNIVVKPKTKTCSICGKPSGRYLKCSECRKREDGLLKDLSSKKSEIRKSIVEGIEAIAFGHRQYLKLGFKSTAQLKADIIDKVYNL